MKYDQITLERINLLHPKVREAVKAAYLHANNVLLPKGVRLRFTHTLRTYAEQDALYAQGRTTPGKKVTNARGGQSIHNYGLAFDIVILLDNDNNGTFETASWAIDKHWLRVAEYFKSLGWTWGGDWASFKDYPHFEKTFGHNWQSLKAKYDADDVFTETIGGEVYKWVNV